MYNVPAKPVSNISNISKVQAIFESISKKVSSSDLSCFVQSFGLDGDVELTGNYESSNNNSCDNTCSEPNLDSQYLSAVNQGVNVEYLAYENFDDMFRNLKYLPDDQLPYVVSISYGQPEYNSIFSNQQQLCSEIRSLTGRGVTFFASTGDNGATNGDKGTCGNGYSINFPASCPYVVAVGGTTGFEPQSEVVCNAGGSGEYAIVLNWNRMQTHHN